MATGERLKSRVRDTAQSLFHDQTERVADAAHGIADALHQAAKKLDEEHPTASQYAERAARQIDRASDAMRDPDFGEIFARTEDFVRRQPTLFIVGAIAAGFVVGRLMARPAASERGPRLEGKSL